MKVFNLTCGLEGCSSDEICCASTATMIALCVDHCDGTPIGSEHAEGFYATHDEADDDGT